MTRGGLSLRWIWLATIHIWVLQNWPRHYVREKITRSQLNTFKIHQKKKTPFKGLLKIEQSLGLIICPHTHSVTVNKIKTKVYIPTLLCISFVGLWKLIENVNRTVTTHLNKKTQQQQINLITWKRFG